MEDFQMKYRFPVRSFFLLCLMLAVVALTGCSAPAVSPTALAASPTVPANPEVILATTTSTRDTGLLDTLIPLFEAQTGYKVKMVAVGSGQALEMGAAGDADVLLVHSPTAEEDFMTQGNGKERLLVMHNDFIIVGPASDPAGIRGETVAADALSKIATTQAVFVSRGDNSGTNTKELGLWKKVGITPEGEWYVQTGQGMGDTLRITSEMEGYTLADRGTYLSLKDTLALEILVEGDSALLNVYHVITINPDKFSKVNYEGALAFANFIVSPDIQKIIGEFGVDKYGQPLFFPDAGK
jgi:tungstate transport system substrate-binding protein